MDKDAAADAMTTSKAAQPRLLFPTGPPAETDDVRDARIEELLKRHMQPVKRDFLAERPPKGEERRERGRNTKRPFDADRTSMKTGAEPAGASDESGKVPYEPLLEMRKNKYAFLTPKGAEGRVVLDDGSTLDVAAYEASDASPPPLARERKIVDFSGKVYVAPLTTVGNLPFRRVLTKYGADITCGEMALATCLNEGQSSEWALLRRHKDEKCFGVQLSAAHGDQMGRCAELVERFADADFVDLNCGCPIDLVCSKGGGAALMKRSAKLKTILGHALGRLSIPVTVKMRTGWDDTKLAHTLAGRVQAYAHALGGPGAVACVFVHGRSRTARYSKPADWRYVELVARCQDDQIPKLPVIGNGDIMSYADWAEKRDAAPTTCDCAMLARGALIKPWLPTELKEKRSWDISSAERLDILRDFCKFGLDHWGADDVGVDRTRRFLLEWLSFLCRYTPVGLLEVLPQRMNHRPPKFVGRDDLETLMASDDADDWVRITELLLGKVRDDFTFAPKHKSNSYASTGKAGGDWG